MELGHNDYVLVDGSLFTDGKQHLFKIVGTPLKGLIYLSKAESEKSGIYRSPAYYTIHGDVVKTQAEQNKVEGLLIPYDEAGSLLTKSNKAGSLLTKEGGKRRNRRSTQGRRRKNRRHHSRRR